MSEASEPRLSAVVYGGGDDRVPIDEMLWQAASELRASGAPLAGVVQRNPQRPGRCRCDMLLYDLASGREVEISEDRGPEARGCRLDVAALEGLVADTVEALDHGARLLIINRFGKREVEGRGFREAIAKAIGLGIPVITAVRRENVDAWREFTGGIADELPPAPAAILDWCRTARAA